MSRAPDVSRLPLHSLQRELDGRSLRRPSRRGRGINERDCPEDDVLYVSVTMKTWDRWNQNGVDFMNNNFKEKMVTRFGIWVHTSHVPAQQPERRIWQEKFQTVIYPILKRMREGAETAMRSAGFSAPFEWFSIRSDNFWNEGLQFECANVPKHRRNYQVLMDVFHRALDYASGYPSRLIDGSIRVDHGYRQYFEIGRFNAFAALCIGEGMGEQHYDPVFQRFDPNETSEEEDQF